MCTLSGLLGTCPWPLRFRPCLRLPHFPESQEVVSSQALASASSQWLRHSSCLRFRLGGTTGFCQRFTPFLLRWGLWCLTQRACRNFNASGCWKTGGGVHSLASQRAWRCVCNLVRDVSFKRPWALPCDARLRSCFVCNLPHLLHPPSLSSSQCDNQGQMCFLCLFVLDSPATLLLQGRRPEAKSAFYRLAGRVASEESDKLLELHFYEMSEQCRLAQESQQPLVQERSSSTRCIVRLAFFLSALNQLNGINYFVAFSNDVFSQVGFSAAQSTCASVVMASANVLSASFAGVPTGLGRHRVLVLGVGFQADACNRVPPRRSVFPSVSLRRSPFVFARHSVSVTRSVLHALRAYVFSAAHLRDNPDKQMFRQRRT